ncbi:MAG: LamG domain-containing protein [Saprospiraceae bacterium]|nr:LamG domain-containing protein [Saprospiraceae bacterium]
MIYVNGIEAKRKPAAGTLNSTALPLIFGNNGSNGGQYFNGALDNLKIYNKALTADEVKNYLLQVPRRPMINPPLHY